MEIIKILAVRKAFTSQATACLPSESIMPYKSVFRLLPSAIICRHFSGALVLFTFSVYGFAQENKFFSQPPPSSTATMLPMARDVAEKIHAWDANSSLTISLPKIGDARFQTSCEPLSGFLKNALQKGLSEVKNIGNVRWVGGDAKEPQGGLVVQWEQLNQENLLITGHLWDLRQTPARDVGTVQQTLSISSLADAARKNCLFKSKPIDKRVQAGRNLLVRTAPAPEAALIENGGNVSTGTPLWIEARLESDHWWLVRLDDDDHRVFGDRVRRGFVHGPIGPTRHVTVETQIENAALAAVAEHHIQEKLSDNALVLQRGGAADLRLRIAVTPSEVRSFSKMFSVEARVTLSVEDLSSTPTVSIARADGDGKAIIASAQDKDIGLEKATQEAAKNAVEKLLQTIEHIL
ncbi:MAG: hypothetical protein HQL78_04835 [Magnetococcales bacterium]|nr:hypothetical protein [Magnetococcales bacterium]